MTPSCPTCGQSLPEEGRRDPPLPPLEQANAVTIHDLTPEERAAAEEVEIYPAGKARTHVYRLRTARDVVDGREGEG